VRNHLTALRYTPREARDQPSQGVDIFLIADGTQPGTLMLLKQLYRGARVGDEAAVGALDQAWSVGDIMFVLDLADNLFDQILDRHQPIDAAKLVYHHRDMCARLAHLYKKIEDRHRWSYEQHLA